jgi:phosphate butyryltransferase
VLIGNEPAIRARIAALGLTGLGAKAGFVAAEDPAHAVACLARDGQVELLLKGHLRTDELLRAVLDKASGLRTGHLLSDVLLYEDKLAGETRLVGITDGGLVVAPGLEQKKQIVENAIAVMQCLGLARPRIAIMSATEAVSDSVPSTVDARLLTEMGEAGQFRDADVFGPLALDCALLESAAHAKGIHHPVAGHADCMVVPNLEAGNLLAKSVKYFGGSQCAHVVVGARVPILIPSRVESVEDKVNSIALGVLLARR